MTISIYYITCQRDAYRYTWYQSQLFQRGQSREYYDKTYDYSYFDILNKWINIERDRDLY